MKKRFTHVPTPYEEIGSKQVRGERIYSTPAGDFPSITTVLGAMADKTWLTAWTKSLGESKAAAEKQRCADRGTAVHLLAEKYLNNDPDYADGFRLDDQKLFNQIKITLNKIDNIRAQEIPMFTELLGIAGRCDCIAEYDGVLSVIDFKTSNGNKDDKVIEDYFLQCTAYSLMYEEMFGVAIEQIVVIIAVEKGMMGQVFKRNRSEYLGKLIKKAKAYYAKRSK